MESEEMRGEEKRSEEMKGESREVKVQRRKDRK